MIKKRSPKRDELVDPARTIFWFHLLSGKMGTCRADKIQRAILVRKFEIDSSAKSSRFSLYAKGKHVPIKAMIKEAEIFVPGSARVIEHVLWDVLRDSKDVKEHARAWIGRLSEEIQKAIRDDDWKIQERVMTREMLLRRFSLDSLAAFTILFRLNAAGVATHWNPATTLQESARNYAVSTPLARSNSPTFGQVKFPQAGQSGL